jgi:hypothetical protein
MASLLTLSLGGIVVWAEDHSEKQAGAPKPPCPNCQWDAVAVAPACCAKPIALPAPTSTLPPAEPVEAVVAPLLTGVIVAQSETPLAPPAANEPVAETKGLLTAAPVALQPEPPTIPILPAAPPPMPATAPADPPATMPPPPVATKVEMPAITLAPTPEPPPPMPMPEPAPTFAPPAPTPTFAPPAPPTIPVTPASITIAPSAPVVAPALSTFPWKLHLEMVAGLTHFELRHNDAVQMRVQCERLDLQSPQGGLQASGRVAVSGPCLEASCDRLLISWQSGQIALEGHVRVICQNNGVRTELGTESICFRLSGSGNPIEFSARDVSQQIMPARR